MPLNPFGDGRHDCCWYLLFYSNVTGIDGIVPHLEQRAQVLVLYWRQALGQNVGMNGDATKSSHISKVGKRGLWPKPTNQTSLQSITSQRVMAVTAASAHLSRLDVDGLCVEKSVRYLFRRNHL